MQNEKREKSQETVGEMQKRRELMEDGRRYIIYYTFEKASDDRRENEKRENV
jgi:hypothetical protein